MSDDAPTCEIANCGLHATDGDRCHRHAREHMRAIARRGGVSRAAQQRAARAVAAAAVRLGTLAEIRATLTAATGGAMARGDFGCVVSACRVALEAVRAFDQEERLARLEAALAAREEGGDDARH